MKKIITMPQILPQRTALICLGASFGFLLAGCDGAFVGPPGGGVGGGGFGGDPIVGANPFTFEPEIESFSGFVTDIWFLNPGLDTDDALTDPNAIANGDGIDCMENCNFEEFSTGNLIRQAPGSPEVNIQFPISMSFISQWFLRNADGSRITTLDVFGGSQGSSSSLDISLVTGPVQDNFDMQGNLIGRSLSTLLYPAGSNPGQGINLPLAGWSTPQGNAPNEAPAPQTLFLQNNFNSLDIISLAFQSADPLGVTNFGGTLEDVDNKSVEHLGTLPNVNQTTNTFPPISESLGFFQDLFALEYINAPVRQPDDIQVPQPQTINDPSFETALIEYSRHVGAVMAWMIGTAVGLSNSNDGTLMDQGVPFLQNGYQYRFSTEDVNKMSSQVVGPTDPQDPDKNVGLLPGRNR